MMHWGNYGCGMGGWVGMIFVSVLVIAGVVYFVQVITGRCRKTASDETSLDILKKRFARGEISKEDFERMKDDLMKS